MSPLDLEWEFRILDGEWARAEVPAPWQRRHPDHHAVGEYRACFSFEEEGPLYVRFEAVACVAKVFLNGTLVGGHTGSWTPFLVDLTPALKVGEANELRVEVDQKPSHTTAGFLPVIDAAFGGIWGPITRVSSARIPLKEPADPGIFVKGDRLFRQGRPLQVRGLLHWGYYPELGAPRPSVAEIEQEVAWMKSLGFNLVKFCLFVPPEEYLQVCEDQELLVWQEYPVWDRPLEDPALVAEFDEMVSRDAAYGCVILRSLTCENSRVDKALAAGLRALVKQRAPGGLLLDNSSFLFSEGSGDFHDEHPYLHGKAWRHYPARMRTALSRLPRKPLLLGETMAVDAWRGEDPPELAERGRRLAVSIRKDQVEILRRELPGAGYVMNSIRDIPAAPLGLCDLEGRPRVTAESFAWHRDCMILIGRDDRSVPASSEVTLPFLVSNFGSGTVSAPLDISFPGGLKRVPVRVAPGETVIAAEIPLPIPAVTEPTPLEVSARLGKLENRWIFWAIPTGAAGFHPGVQVATPRHGSLRTEPHWFHSPIPRFAPVCSALDCELIVDLLGGDLMSGRVLQAAPWLRPVVEVLNQHDNKDGFRALPLVGVAQVAGEKQIWSALRHDTPAGHWLLDRFSSWLEQTDPPETELALPCESLLLEEFEMTDPAGDTSHVRAGDGVTLCGRARFACRFEIPAEWHQQPLELCCDGVADGFLLKLDGELIGERGNLDIPWDSCRYQPARFPLRLSQGPHDLEFAVRDWTAGGALTGAIWLTTDPENPFY